MIEETIDQLVREYAQSPDNHCFGCGLTNPSGLQLQVVREDGAARAHFVPGEWQEGWEGVVHGGILAAALDEVMAYTLFFDRIKCVTARLELRYRVPVRQGDRLVIEARIVRSTRRIADVEGTIRRDGRIVAEASGRFMKLGVLEREDILA
jgi:acyl-coenzyme A thioesterase PaaI-like protein